MSDVLIVAGDASAAQRLQETLELEGAAILLAHDLLSALPELYLSPNAMRVILAGEGGEELVMSALALVAADPGPLGRHSYTTLEVELGASISN